jgi:hypothetical protein
MRNEVVNNDDQHFIMRFDRPARIEVSVVDGKVIAHAYSGYDTDIEQEPDLVYDGSIVNESSHGRRFIEHAKFVDQLVNEGPATGQTRF